MKRITTMTYLKALAKSLVKSFVSVMFPTMAAVLSITMGVCVLLIVGAEDLALRVVALLPASVVIFPIYFTLKQWFTRES